jgi:hypothetical protein
VPGVAKEAVAVTMGAVAAVAMADFACRPRLRGELTALLPLGWGEDSRVLPLSAGDRLRGDPRVAGELVRDDSLLDGDRSRDAPLKAATLDTESGTGLLSLSCTA